MFATVANTMGYTATWLPSAGGAAITATVLYKGPTIKEKLFDAAYSPDNLTLEYKVEDLQGLKQSVDEGNEECITITGIATFVIRSIQTTFDGKTITANLQQVTE